jgi:hypothetical protein
MYSEAVPQSMRMYFDARLIPVFFYNLEYSIPFNRKNRSILYRVFDAKM